MKRFLTILSIVLLLTMLPALTARAQVGAVHKPHLPKMEKIQQTKKKSTRVTKPKPQRRNTTRPARRHTPKVQKPQQQESPEIEVTFGCNVPAAIITIDDDEPGSIDESYLLKEDIYKVVVEAEGYEPVDTVIEVKTDDDYFYFELVEVPLEAYSEFDDPIVERGLGKANEIVTRPEVLEVGDSDDKPSVRENYPEGPLANQSITVKGVTFEMVHVEGGTFMRYQKPDNLAAVVFGDVNGVPPANKVQLSGYYIGKYEVTRELWYAVMADSVLEYHPKEPMTDVSWYECRSFLEKLNSLTGRHFRLPTDAEWEFAAIGGNKSHGYVYSGGNKIEDVAWYSENSELKYADVGTKWPNELGIFDMTGSVWEWCADWCIPWYDWPDYNEQTPAMVDPKGPDTEQKSPSGNGYGRVTRGGGLGTDAVNCCICRPDHSDPSTRSGDLGLRLAM